LTGSDTTPRLLAWAEERGYRVFLFGSDQQTLEKIGEIFPKAVVGLKCPPVHPELWRLEEENRNYVNAIKEARPDILLVALGVRKQELWTQKYFKECGVPITICIGASLDFIAGRIRRAPKWVSKIGLEWLWRLAMEPGRLWPRYSGDMWFLFRYGLIEVLKRENKVR
jgi:N-acetylglucosaminyldiphosphoundecaprenol N-acetyl-beta-D-mannosaminyltransferase